MENKTCYCKETPAPLRKTAALVDGVIMLAGLTVAVGSIFNSEIVMWWLGA